MQDQRPDHGQGIRFGCGFIFGAFMAAFSSLALSIYNAYYLIALLLATGIVFGFLSLRYGDEFWYSLKSWLGWW